jgi:hypothetical protein
MNNRLNLVFDAWDLPNIPRPNLDFINGEKTVCELPFFIMTGNFTNKDHKVRLCDLTDINDSENFYYVINHFCPFFQMIIGNNWLISESVEDCIRHKNLNVIFMSLHESFNNFHFDMQLLRNVLKLKGLNECQFYIINNNSLFTDSHKTFDSKINLIKSDFLIEVSSSSLSQGYPNIKMYDGERKFTFLCQNRRPKTHRLTLLSLLRYNNLLVSDLIDWSLTYGNKNDDDLITFGDKLFFDNEKSPNIINDFNEITSLPKLGFYEQDKHWFNKPKNYRHFQHIEYECFKNSYINIVSESNYEVKEIHITEKTYKPFYFFQIPIFLATYGHVKMLKKEQNFYLFDDLVDHSYDDEVDNIKRMYMVIDEIKRLSNMKGYIKEYYNKNMDKLIHNHNYIKNFKDTNSTMNLFSKLINKN